MESEREKYQVLINGKPSLVIQAVEGIKPSAYGIAMEAEKELREMYEWGTYCPNKAANGQGDLFEMF